MTTVGMNYLNQVTRTNGINIKVDKVHSAQGVTAETVFLILSDFGTHDWGLNGDRSYIYSACARARSKLILLSDLVGATGSLTDFLTKRGGSGLPLNIFKNVEMQQIRATIQTMYGESVEVNDEKEILYNGKIIGKIGGNYELVANNSVLRFFSSKFSPNRHNINRSLVPVLMQCLFEQKVNMASNFKRTLSDYTIELVKYEKGS
jgi:hypothetical protein